MIEQLIKVDFFGKVKSDFGLMDENLEVQDKFIAFMKEVDFDKNLKSKEFCFRQCRSSFKNNNSDLMGIPHRYYTLIISRDSDIVNA